MNMEQPPPAVDSSRFDAIAATWDEDSSRVALARAVGASIKERAGLLASHRVLDYGCGTGLLTLAVQPLVQHVTGADTSAGMLEMLARKVADAGLANVDVRRLSDADSFGVGGRFDRIVSSMTMHHVQDVPALLRRFRDLLAPGGRVALADLDLEDGTFHKPGVTDVYHPGFDRAQFLQWLADAGFSNGSAATAFVHTRNSREYPVFLAVADA
jgi:tRNA (cmo5U34)-methyltransferase